MLSLSKSMTKKRIKEHPPNLMNSLYLVGLGNTQRSLDNRNGITQCSIRQSPLCYTIRALIPHFHILYTGTVDDGSTHNRPCRPDYLIRRLFGENEVVGTFIGTRGSRAFLIALDSGNRAKCKWDTDLLPKITTPIQLVAERL